MVHHAIQVSNISLKIFWFNYIYFQLIIVIYCLVTECITVGVLSKITTKNTSSPVELLCRSDCLIYLLFFYRKKVWLFVGLIYEGFSCGIRIILTSSILNFRFHFNCYFFCTCELIWLSQLWDPGSTCSEYVSLYFLVQLYHKLCKKAIHLWQV